MKWFRQKKDLSEGNTQPKLSITTYSKSYLINGQTFLIETGVTEEQQDLYRFWIRIPDIGKMYPRQILASESNAIDCARLLFEAHCDLIDLQRSYLLGQPYDRSNQRNELPQD